MDEIDRAVNRWLQKPSAPREDELLRLGFELVYAVHAGCVLARRAQQLIARPGVTVAEVAAAREFADEAEPLAARLEKFKPTIRVFQALLAKHASVEQTVLEAFDALEDDLVRARVLLALSGP